MDGSIRRCALRIIELLDKVGDDVLAEEGAINEALGELLEIPGLDTMVATPARSASDAGLGWLYSDGDVRIVRGVVTAGMHLEPHNHGAWNLFGVYRGALHYRSYRRRDDQSVPYYADLEVAEDRIMGAGDVTVLPSPPHDIHEVIGLAPETFTVLVARGPFSPVRQQYYPDRRAYLVHGGDGFGAPNP